jgi:hypothetical protein
MSWQRSASRSSLGKGRARSSLTVFGEPAVFAQIINSIVAYYHPLPRSGWTMDAGSKAERSGRLNIYII